MPLRSRTDDQRRSVTKIIGRKFYYHSTKPEQSGAFVTHNVTEGMLLTSQDELHGRPPYNRGGPFFLARENFANPPIVSGICKPFAPPPTSADLVGYRTGYTGSFFAANFPGSLSLEPLPMAPGQYSAKLNPDDLTGLGDEAFQKLRPKQQKAGLAQAIIESREVPQMLKTTAKGFAQSWELLGGNKRGFRMHPGIKLNERIGNLYYSGKRRAKDVSDHFLNHQFGWKPFLKEVDDTLKLVDNYFTTIKELERSNGKWVRKAFTEDVLESNNVVYDVLQTHTSTFFTPCVLPLPVDARTSRRVVSRQTISQVWYEGVFRVYSPEFDKGIEMHDQVRSARQFLTVAGARINPVVLYKVTPWTWLIDWFSGFGRNVQALQDAITGEAVNKYLYVMRYCKDQFTYYVNQTHLQAPALSGSVTWYRETKRRASADNPFGFALPTGGLTGQQYAILTALGINRL